MDLKVIFWGCGKTAERFLINHPLFLEKVHVVGFTDTDSKKWNTFLGQYKIEPPFVVLRKNYDYIVILSIYFSEIKNTLTGSHSVSAECILSVDEAYELYFRRKNSIDHGHLCPSPQLLAEVSVSEKNYKRNLKETGEYFSYLHLKEEYLSWMQAMKPEKKESAAPYDQEKSDTPIWVCWLQGMENAPEIVRCCINSIKRHVEGNIHLITYENFSSYVNLDRNIIEKHKLGLMSSTHFSDILRLALLYQYGGIWMDATILLMDSGLPDYVYKFPLFMYKIRTTMDEGYSDPRKFSNWFISARKGNPLIEMTYRFINYYWMEESGQPYYLMHYAVRLLWDQYDNTDKNKLLLYNCNCRLLYKLLNKPYDALLWDMIKEEQPMQKLTYKKNFVTGSSFYQHICDSYL